MKQTERHWYLATSLLLLLVALVGLWGYQQHRATQRLDLRAESQYQQSYYNLLGYIGNLEATLGKALVFTTPERHVETYTEVWRQAFSAQEELSRLPLNHIALSRTEKFLSQVGDYSYSLAKAYAKNEVVSAQQKQTVENLLAEVQVLNKDLRNLQASLIAGNFRWTSNPEKGTRELEKAEPKTAMDGFRQIDARLINVPSLIYDGPFSDHMANIVPKLKGETISVQQALEVARVFLTQAGIGTTGIRFTANNEGLIPSFGIEVPRSGNGAQEGRVHLEVSRQGGQVVWMLWERPVATAKKNLAEAQKIAADFITKRGFTSMVIVGAITQERETVVSFAGVQDNIVIYPDMIKVKVALDNGQITGYEARNYLAAHTTRPLVQPKLSINEARSKVNTNVNIRKERMALIPTETGQEVLTYEFNGIMQGREYFIYINALTGAEERILQVIDTGQGPLTL
jgi:spore germination protein